MKIGDLFEYAILGSGDLLMAVSLIGKVEDYLHHPYVKKIFNSPGFLTKIFQFESACQSNHLKLSYISGKIFHKWHGSRKDRKYMVRYNIFLNHTYNPNIDLVKNSDGILSLSEYAYGILNEEFYRYFVGRNEDNRDINAVHRLVQ